MSCPRVRVVPPSCTCGRELDITQWHGDDELGNPLCPTCSGCGCEPNERNLMNEQEPEALPGHAIGLAAEFEWKARQCRVLGNDRTFVEADLLDAAAAELRLLHPFPEPDHSMCARLVPHPDDPRNRHGLQSPNGSYLTLPHDGPVFVAPDDYWRERGYAIPEPEPTVMERAAEVLNHVDLRGNDLGTVFAEALDAAGLLVRDGEQ